MLKKPVICIIYLLLLILTSSYASGQKFEFIKLPDLEKILENPDNKLFVINFWATWCPPCIREFPVFEKVSKELDPAKVKFIMVSLDSRDDLESKLIPFIERNNVSLDVALMTDSDIKSWSGKVYPIWHGELPSTIVFNNSRKIRHFHMGEIDESGLRKLISSGL